MTGRSLRLFPYRGSKIRAYRGAYRSWVKKKFRRIAVSHNKIHRNLRCFAQHHNMALKRKQSSSLGLERRVRPRKEDEWEEEPESQNSSSEEEEDDDEVEEQGIRGEYSDDEEDEDIEGQESEDGSEDESEVSLLRSV